MKLDIICHSKKKPTKQQQQKKKTVQYTIKKICIFVQHKIIIISYLIWLFYSNFHFSDHHSQIDLLHYGKIIQWDFFFPCTANKQWKNMPPQKTCWNAEIVSWQMQKLITCVLITKPNFTKLLT